MIDLFIIYYLTPCSQGSTREHQWQPERDLESQRLMLFLILFHTVSLYINLKNRLLVTIDDALRTSSAVDP